MLVLSRLTRKIELRKPGSQPQRTRLLGTKMLGRFSSVRVHRTACQPMVDMHRSMQGTVRAESVG